AIQQVRSRHDLQSGQPAMRRSPNKTRVICLRGRVSCRFGKRYEDPHFSIFTLYDPAQVADHLYPDFLAALYGNDNSAVAIWPVLKQNVPINSAICPALLFTVRLGT